jgi:predicted  nucleic acid-binding Zn-ribbon protein
VPADLIALYERLRAANAGIGAAALRARKCGGCRIELYGTELVRAREAAEDEVLRCEECGRILIRTAESGL